jgi:uncharacterized surface protein with fasciclin (FAS1) repeats
MKILKRKFLTITSLVLSAILLFASCDKEDSPVVQTETLDAKIAANSDLSLFRAALEKTRLNVFTKGGGPFTVWAPNNAAFNAAGITTAADLNAIDSNTLVQILTYHIQVGARSFFEIPVGPNATMTTQGGQTQYASRKPGGSAFINGAEVIQADIAASNGYMHIINRVLIPPFLTPAQALAAEPNYARFYQALLKTATSTTTNPLTFFVVSNTVMVAAGYDSTTIANATGTALTTLTGIMKYHTVNKRIFASDFVAGPLKTVQGTNVTISTTGGLTVKGTNNPAAFTITPNNLLTTTAVIHTINGLLKP